jgi:hypothetical protein
MDYSNWFLICSEISNLSSLDVASRMKEIVVSHMEEKLSFIFLSSRPSRTSNLCMRSPHPNHLIGEVYEGIHTLTPSGFELVTF